MFELNVWFYVLIGIVFVILMIFLAILVDTYKPRAKKDPNNDKLRAKIKGLWNSYLEPFESTHGLLPSKIYIYTEGDYSIQLNFSEKNSAEIYYNRSGAELSKYCWSIGDVESFDKEKSIKIAKEFAIIVEHVEKSKGYNA